MNLKKKYLNDMLIQICRLNCMTVLKQPSDYLQRGKALFLSQSTFKIYIIFEKILYEEI